MSIFENFVTCLQINTTLFCKSVFRDKKYVYDFMIQSELKKGLFDILNMIRILLIQI